VQELGGPSDPKRVRYMNKRTRGTRLGIIGAGIVLLFSSIFVAAPAQAAAPVLLSGSSWFSGNGVSVCDSSTDTTCDGESHVGGISSNWWQCVELAQRFYKSQGWYSGIFSGVMVATDIWTNAANLGMSTQANGSITSIVPGDMIVFDADASNYYAGHVAIVDSISGSTVNIVEQNTTNDAPRGTLTLSSGSLTRGSGAAVLGVVHDPDNTSTSSSSTIDGAVPVYQLSNGGYVAFARGSDNQLYNTWQSGAGTSWNAMTLVTAGTGMASSPTMYLGSNGAFTAFATNTGGQIVTTWQSSAGSSWASWQALPSGPSALVGLPVVYPISTGGLVAFAKGADNQLYNTWQTSAGSSWTTPTLVTSGSFNGQVTVVKESSGAFTAYGINSSGQPITTWQSSAGSSWNGWTVLTTGGQALTGTPAVSMTNSGGYVLFARGTDGALYNTWQTGPGTSWVSLQAVVSGNGVASSPTVYKSSSGAFTIFAVNTAGFLVTTWQSSPGSSWNSWAQIGGSPTFSPGIKPTIMTASSGALVAFLRGTNGQLWNTWQTSAGSSWVTAQPVTTGNIAP
jgi:hypothetical protein